MSKTKVIFRKWKTNGDIIALFPEDPGTYDPATCESYEHIGQHGAAHPAGVVANTRPTTEEEAAELARELTAIGYDLEPVARIPGNAYAIRAAVIESCLTGAAPAE